MKHQNDNLVVGGIIMATVVFFMFLTNCNSQKSSVPQKLRALIVTGGHGFERDSFFAMFDSFKDIEFREVQHPQANNSYAPEEAETYDVLVFYDMNQDITTEQKAALIRLLEKGKGLVVLHHALASYQEWEEYEKIIGGLYHLEPYTKDEHQLPASTYKHDVDFLVHVVNPQHPVTQGIEDFTIHDEIYNGYSISPTVQPLLTTDHPESENVIAWTNKYGNSHVVFIQLGHDHFAYENPNYRRLVAQAIRWTAQEQ